MSFKEGDDLMDVLKKLPIAEESETANNLQMTPLNLQVIKLFLNIY